LTASSIGIAYHLLLCATPAKPACCSPEQGGRSWQRLKQLIRELGLEDQSRPEGLVLRSKVDCLRVCRKGPILLVWPDGLWYEGVNEERVERIIHEHILQGCPVSDFLLRQTPWRRDLNAVAPVPGENAS